MKDSKESPEEKPSPVPVMPSWDPKARKVTGGNFPNPAHRIDVHDPQDPRGINIVPPDDTIASPK